MSASTLAKRQDSFRALLLERGLNPDTDEGRPLVRQVFTASENEIEEFFGHGPLADPLGDPAVTEILVNGPAEIWLERDGKLSRAPGAFSSEESLRRYVRRLLASRGRKVDQREPFADAKLDCGSRLHVAGPPIACRVYCLSIRKFSALPWNFDRLQAQGTLSARAAQFLAEAVAARKNILVAGGTGSGKTSLLGALLSAADPAERIILLEDVAEIRAEHPHLIPLEARPANQEGEGRVDLRRLLRESLRMRPERLVVGECRGPEALDLLLALNTGHPGSMATIHANSPREALSRLETLASLASDNLRDSVVKALVCGSVQLVLQMERTPNGRRLTRAAEIRGVDGGAYLLKEIDLS